MAVMQKISLLISFIFICTFSFAQKWSDIKTDAEPLVLKSVGSFYVGGETELQTRSEMGNFFPEGHITVNQMYVNFMVPQKQVDSTSFVFIHGITLSGKTYETTPDGRMGWNEYFARKGHATFVVDQVGIGRSGFNAKAYNRARNKEIEPSELPLLFRISDENTLLNFRFADSLKKALVASKFPAEAYTEFSKQSIPFTAATVTSPDVNFSNLSLLAKDLKHTVLVSHSQSGAFPVQTALLNPEGIDALVLIEPGGTGANYTDAQVAKLKNIPVLLVFGDNIEAETGVPGHSWKEAYDGWNSLIERLKKRGGKAETFFLPQMGIKGNSHMLMMDTNNQQIADLILAWFATNKN